MAWFAFGLFGIAALLAILLGPHNVRRWRARRDAKRLPIEIIEQVFGELADMATAGGGVTFLRPMQTQVTDPTESHWGGLPYAEQGDAWPQGGDGSVDFLIQVRLDAPSLDAVWHGRLVQVFLSATQTPTVLCHTAPDKNAFVEIYPPSKPLPVAPLRHLPLPEFQQHAESGAWSQQLVAASPKITSILAPYSKDVEGLITHVLCPFADSYETREFDVAFVGGVPILIQNSHDAACPTCGQAMRFLFQFGEIPPNQRLGDGGVCYVYGCDSHPDTCQAFVDSH